MDQETRWDYGERKLVAQGGSYTITLPPSWIKAQNVKGKIKIIMDKDYSLRIMPCAAKTLIVSVRVPLSA